MELPFKYIIFQIIKILYKRNMPLIISKNKIAYILEELIKRLYLTEKEKIEIIKNFDYEYEISALLDKYYQCFEMDGNEIIFDKDYIFELETYIIDEKLQYDMVIVYDIECLMNENFIFLDIIGVKVKDKLYNYLLNIEKEIEDCYNELCYIECYNFETKEAKPILIKKIKELKLKKAITLTNANNLLTEIEMRDLMLYASEISSKINLYDDVSLIIKDENFDETDIVYDVFLRNIFTDNDSYIINLREELVLNCSNVSNDIKYSIVKFYTIFLKLLENEIGNYDDIINTELNRVKYRIINTLDSVYKTAFFMEKKTIYDEFKEKYCFAKTSSLYFVKELLFYDDSKYVNEQYNTNNIMIYFNNLMKKLHIETYYLLTKDKSIIESIKNNEFYGVNKVSSSFLYDIVEKPKTKIKEV